MSATSGGAAINLTSAGAGNVAGGITLSTGNNLGTYGILNGSAAALAIGGSGTGVVTLPTTTSGNLFVTAGNAQIQIAAPIADNGAGVLSLVKGGNGAVVLRAANTFTGGITINAGTLTFSSLAAGMDGTGKNITFGGTSTLDTGVDNWDGGQLSVASGALGSITARTLNFASTTGSGEIRVLSGNKVVNLGDGSTFTGSIRKDAGGDGGVVQFSSLSDASGAGNLIFAGGSGDSNQRITIRYSGSSTLTFDNRSIELLPKPSNWGVRNAILENNSGGSNKWVINTDLINQTDRNTEFTLSGSNAGDNEFAGVIGDSIRGTYYQAPGLLALNKTGTGKWIVSGTNTFTGRVLVNQGTLSVDTIANSGVASAIGAGNLIQLGGSERYFNGNNGLFSGNNSGTLEYTGGTANSDRTFLIGDTAAGNTGGGTLANNGSGALSFTATNFNDTITGITATRTLTLGGTNTANNEIQGVIQDNVVSTGKINLAKAGAGTWVLGGDNTYTGTTSVNDGLLLVNGDNSAAGGNVTVALAGTLGGTGTIGGATTLDGTLSPGNSPGTLSFVGNLTVNNGATYLFEGGDLTAVGGTLDLNDNWTLALSSGLADGGSITIFTYGTLAATPDLVPTFDLTSLGFTPSGALSLTDTGSAIVLNGISVVPEPTTLGLLGLGAVGLMRRRRVA